MEPRLPAVLTVDKRDAVTVKVSWLKQMVDEDKKQPLLEFDEQKYRNPTQNINSNRKTASLDIGPISRVPLEPWQGQEGIHGGAAEGS